MDDYVILVFNLTVGFLLVEKLAGNRSADYVALHLHEQLVLS